MSPEPGRRKKAPRQYRVLIVPSEEGGRTRSITLDRIRMVLAGLGVLVVIVFLTLATVMYTPLGRYVPIPNPELERRYGAQLRDTQERLQALAEDVLLLRDYNIQLRKVLGDDRPDSTRKAKLGPSVMVSEALTAAATDSGTRVSSMAADRPAQSNTDISSSYASVVTGIEGFRAAFPLVSPAEGFVTQEFDPAAGHFGIDYAARSGAPIVAAADGYVIFAGWTYESGNMLMLAHGGGYVTVYRHARSLFRGEHAFVKRGELIALIGNTGRTSSGPHLHFEFWKDGLAVDPREYLLTPPTIQ
jgi:murein DD-endopeptidase MepM/ murein hydrolase activator NlpD